VAFHDLRDESVQSLHLAPLMRPGAAAHKGRLWRPDVDVVRPGQPAEDADGHGLRSARKFETARRLMVAAASWDASKAARASVARWSAPQERTPQRAAALPVALQSDRAP
jgi:hypothetical protein